MLSKGLVLLTLAATASLSQAQQLQSPLAGGTSVSFSSAKASVNMWVEKDASGLIKSLSHHGPLGHEQSIIIDAEQPGIKVSGLVDVSGTSGMKLTTEIDPAVKKTTQCFGEGLFQTYRTYLVTKRGRYLLTTNEVLAENTSDGARVWDAQLNQYVYAALPTSPVWGKILDFRLHHLRPLSPEQEKCAMEDDKITGTDGTYGVGTINVSVKATVDTAKCHRYTNWDTGDGSVFGHIRNHNDLVQMYNAVLTFDSSAIIKFQDRNYGILELQDKLCPL